MKNQIKNSILFYKCIRTYDNKTVLKTGITISLLSCRNPVCILHMLRPAMFIPTTIIKIKCYHFLMKTIFNAKLFILVNNGFHALSPFHSPFKKTSSVHTLISRIRKQISDSDMWSKGKYTIFLCFHANNTKTCARNSCRYHIKKFFRKFVFHDSFQGCFTEHLGVIRRWNCFIQPIACLCNIG